MTTSDRHPPHDPIAQYAHLVEPLTEQEQKATDGGWWLDTGMIVWRGGWQMSALGRHKIKRTRNLS